MRKLDKVDRHEIDNHLTGEIIGAAIEVHKHLGPGLLESIYQSCMAHELYLRKLSFQQEKSLPVQYKGMVLEKGYLLDFLVEEKVVVELKTIKEILPVHQAQILTYMKLAECRLGLLLNFNVAVMHKGIRRFIS